MRKPYFNLRRRRGFHAETPMDVELVCGGGSGGQEASRALAVS